MNDHDMAQMLLALGVQLERPYEELALIIRHDPAFLEACDKARGHLIEEGVMVEGEQVDEESWDLWTYNMSLRMAKMLLKTRGQDVPKFDEVSDFLFQMDESLEEMMFPLDENIQQEIEDLVKEEK